MTCHVGAQEDGRVARQLPQKQLEPPRLVRKVFQIAVDKSLCASMHASQMIRGAATVYAADADQFSRQGISQRRVSVLAALEAADR